MERSSGLWSSVLHIALLLPSIHLTMTGLLRNVPSHVYIKTVYIVYTASLPSHCGNPSSSEVEECLLPCLYKVCVCTGPPVQKYLQRSQSQDPSFAQSKFQRNCRSQPNIFSWKILSKASLCSGVMCSLQSPTMPEETRADSEILQLHLKLKRFQFWIEQ